MSVLRSLFVAPAGEAVAPLKKAVNYLLVCVAVILVVGCSLGAVGITLNFDFVGQYRLRIFDGFMLTVWLSVASLIGSMLIGVPVALGKNSRILPIRYLCDLYVKIIRGTPLIAQIYLFYYIIGTAWGVENRVVAGIIILSVFAGAYIAEIVRAGYESLDRGPLEAARAPGAHPRADCRVGGATPDGDPHASGADRSVRLHHQGLVAALGHRRHRVDPDHARDQRDQLQLLRVLPAPGGALPLPDPAGHAGEPPL